MKLRKKLLLSLAALAACATTFVSTTFAWYTTNTKVEANNVTGASADSGAASIFISGDGSKWYQKVDATSTGDDKFTVSSTTLSPVTLKDGEWIDQLGTTVGAPTYVEFTLHFKTAKLADGSAPVNLAIDTIKIENTTGTVKTVDNLLDGSTYSEDLLDALAMQIVSTTVADIDQNGFSLTPGTGCVSHITEDKYVEESTPASGAHEYCNAIAPGSVTVTSTTTAALASNTLIAKLPANGDATTVTFRIFLDGADTDCFDACKGQSFKLNIGFKIQE